MLPNVLYHGSAYWTNELKPGFEHTGIEVQWDETESNRFLYATTERETAIELGLASAIEKAYTLNSYQTRGNAIMINCDQKITVKDLYDLEVWIYTIQPGPKENWSLNKNPHNGLSTEFKTDHTVRSIRAVDRIDIKKWLRNKDVIIGE